MVAEVTTGDHSEGADPGQRARLRPAQRVLASAIANPLAFGAAGQVDVSRKDVARLSVTPITVTVADVPAGIVARGAAALVGLLPVTAWAAPQRPCVIVAAFSPRVAQVVEVSGIEIHDTSLSMDRTIATVRHRILGDNLVTIVRGLSLIHI